MQTIGFHLDDMDEALLSDYGKVYELNKQIRELKKQLEISKIEAINTFVEEFMKKLTKEFIEKYAFGGWIEVTETTFLHEVKKIIQEMAVTKNDSSI